MGQADAEDRGKLISDIVVTVEHLNLSIAAMGLPLPCPSRSINNRQK